MSRVPPALARRLDRLARRAHRFHRFAHHPLCGAYAPEVVRLGRRAVVCRGCACAAAGAVAGGLAAACPPPGPRALLAVALLLALAAASATSRTRRAKLLTRAAPVALAVALLGWGARAGTASGLVACAAATSALALAFAAYRRRGPDRRPCLTCPERAGAAACAGFRPVVRREAAFGRLASRLVARAEAEAGRVRAAPGVAIFGGHATRSTPRHG